MASVISGAGLGLYNSSLNVLGSANGNTQLGANGNAVYVNSQSGNLVVQQQDEFLTSLGIDLGVVRTYNSQGQLDDDNGDNWRLNVNQRLHSLTGTANTAGSTFIKVFGDGHESLYNYDVTLGYYVSTDGSNANDTLVFNNTTNQWTWSSGLVGQEEVYDINGQLLNSTDVDGNILSYTYTGTLLTSISDASGQTTYFDYLGNNLSQVRTVSAGKTEIRTRYSYDTQDRLTEVTVDLTPADGVISDGNTFVTQYSYDGLSKRLASITSGDGVSIAFIYDVNGRVKTYTDGAGQITTFTYTDSAALNTTTITTALPDYTVQQADSWRNIALQVYGTEQAAQALSDYFETQGVTELRVGTILTMPATLNYTVYSLGQLDVLDSRGYTTSYIYNERGLLEEVLSPAVNAQQASTKYVYDTYDNVVSIENANGYITTINYNADNTLANQQDAGGNRVEYVYTAANLVSNEIVYLTPDVDGAGSAVASDPVVTRYVYDLENHLHFEVSAEGRVQEHRYNPAGERISSIRYTAATYPLTTLLVTDALTETELQNWASTQDLSQTQRTDFSYDFRGNISTTTQYQTVNITGVGVIDGTESVTGFIYDQQGQLLQTVDARGMATVDPTDYITQYSYDGLGRLLSTTNALGRSTITTYDDANQKVVTTLANGLSTSSVFDARGLLLSQTQTAPDATPLGTTQYQYDSESRLRITTDPLGAQTHALYDNNDRQIASIDALGAVTENIYNVAGERTSTIQYATLLTPAALSTLTDVSGNPVEVDFNTLRPTSSSADRQTTYEYDKAGRLSKTTDAEGVVTVNQYNGASQLIGTETFGADGTVIDVITVTVSNTRRDDTSADQRIDGTESIDVLAGLNGNDSLYGRGGNDTLSGNAGNDSLYGDTGNDILFGDAGNDNLQGGIGNDTLSGGTGNDSLYGQAGDDTLIAGSGDDQLYGGAGNDTYYFERGFGNDNINNSYQNYEAISARTDIIQFGPGILPSDVKATRVLNASTNHDLILEIIDTGDKVTIYRYFNSEMTSTSFIDEIRFDDTTVWGINEISVLVQLGSEQEDALYSYQTGSNISAGGGDDSLVGSSGDDLLQGDAGNDRLSAGSGNDTLVGGSGNDILDGISGNNTLLGGVGNDVLNGGTGDDYLAGGTGSDTLKGGNGNDTYYFTIGDGADTIVNGYPNTQVVSARMDVLQFGTGILTSDIHLSVGPGSSYTDLVLNRFSSGDSITIKGYFAQSGTGVNTLNEIRFDDATVWTYVEVQALLPTMPAITNQYLSGTALPETLNGGTGSDNILTYQGNDTIDGGAGNDSLQGGDDNDTVIGGVGNDYLYGNAGDDSLIGGLGNDTLYGNEGNDVYLFSRGFGQDTIRNYTTAANFTDIDVIEFDATILPADVIATRTNTDLILQIIGTEDQLTIFNYFYNDAVQTNTDSYYSVNEIRFSDLTVWNIDTVKTKVLQSTQGRDSLYGYATDDILNGGEGIDTLEGYAGADQLFGGLGNDTLTGGDDDDLLNGGVGNDTLSASAGNDTLIGGYGNDTLNGEAGNDTYYFERGFGQDIINIGWNNFSDYNRDELNIIEFGASIASTDVLVRRSGNDLYLYITNSDDRIQVGNFFNNAQVSNPEFYNYAYEVRFNDTTVWNLAEIKRLVQQPTVLADNLYSYGSEDNLIYGKGGNDIITGADGNDYLDGGDGNDTITASDGNDYLIGGLGNDSLSGEVGNDLLEGNAGDDRLFGGAGADTLDAGSGNDYLEAGSGDDRLIGGIGDDTLRGNTGNNTYYFERGFGNDTLNNGYNNWDAFGTTVDAIEFGPDILPEDIIITRGYSDLILSVVGTSDTITVSSYFLNDGTSAYLIDEIRFSNNTVWDFNYVRINSEMGTSQADNLYSLDSGSTLYGLGGNDNLTAQNTNSIDVFDGGSGDDNLSGLGGNDTLIGGSGNDGLWGGVNDDLLLGGDGKDMLLGETGNDTLIGGVGNDTLYAGSGNDVYFFDRGFGQDTINNYYYNYDAVASRLDVIQFGAGILPTEVYLYRSYTDVLNIGITGTDDLIRIDSYFSNDATGQGMLNEIRFDGGAVWNVAEVKLRVQQSSESNNNLYSYTPGDVLNGGAGEDNLYGEAGVDILNGDAGNDVLFGAANVDTLFGGTGNDSLDGGAGNDLLQGEVGNDTLTGGLGDDTLIGGSGADILSGSAGNDIYYFERGFGRDTINNSAGSSISDIDAIEFSVDILPTDIRAYRDNLNLILELIGTEDRITVTQYFDKDADIALITSHFVVEEIRFLSDATVWDINTVKLLVQQSTQGNDNLYSYATGGLILGGTGSDTLLGKEGVDQLYGGFGLDSLDGGAGNDLLVGDEGNDSLLGMDGNDTLIGGLGNDSLTGGYGNDTYIYNRGDGQDTIKNSGNNGQIDVLKFGIDILPSDINVRIGGYGNYGLYLDISGGADSVLISFYLYNNGLGTETLSEIRFDADNSTVWTYADILTLLPPTESYVQGNTLDGTTGPDTLIGGSFRDYITGNAGDDLIQGVGGPDVLYGEAGLDQLYGGAGSDTLYGGSGNDLLYGETGDDALFGQSGNDQLFGGLGNDNLEGDTGDDTLIGAQGNDILKGGEGNDIYKFDLGFGIDTLTNWVGYDTTAQYDVVEFGVGINAADVTAIRRNDDLILTLAQGQGQLKIVSYFNTDASTKFTVNEIRFTEGPLVWTTAYIKDLVKGPATDGDDQFYNYATGGILNGGEGNDTLTGATGLDILNGGTGTDILYGRDNNDTLSGNAGNDTLYGEAGADTLSGEIGNDTLLGGVGNDLLQGGVGDDALYGNEDNDILVGGTGNDTLSGDLGNDIYRFETGFGQDTIAAIYSKTDLVETNVIEFGVGILPTDVFAHRVNDNLILEIIGTEDRITVNQYFDTDALRIFSDAYGNFIYSVEEIHFDSDPTVWDIATVKALVLTSSETHDELYTYDVGNSLNGLGGNDTLIGKEGKDTLYGNGGNDTISAGGNDDFIDGGSGIDTIHGGDGSDTLLGGAGNDYLYGYASGYAGYNALGDDTLIGGTGNDSLNGGFGNTTYIFEQGFGQDTINYAASVDNYDTLIFGAGILPDDIHISRNWTDLFINVIGTEDNIRIAGFWQDEYVGDFNLAAPTHGVDEIKFDNGTIWNLDAIRARTLEGTDNKDELVTSAAGSHVIGGNGNDWFYNYTGASGVGNDHLEGGAGNDNITGYNGTDLLEGGEGNDTLSGGNGNDTLIGGIGNDTLRGDNGNNVLRGGEDNDSLTGGTGNDILYGDAGNDTLSGSTGNDIYRFERGFGSDTISNYSYDLLSNRTDVIQFVAGIRPEDVWVSRNYDNLILQLRDSSDQITVSNYFNTDGASQYLVDEVQFEDGTVWRLNDINNLLGGLKNSQETTLSWVGEKAYSNTFAFISVDGKAFAAVKPNNNTYTVTFNQLTEGEHSYVIEYRDALGNVLKRGNNSFTVYETGTETQASRLESVVAQDSARVTRFFYDKDGNLTQTLDAEGYITESTFNAAGNLTDSISYAQPVSSIPKLASREDVVLNDKPVGYWKLDESTGVAAKDSSGNGLDGLYGSALVLAQAGAIPTSTGTAIQFNGTNGTDVNAINLGNDSRIQLSTGTVEAWVNTSDVSATSRIIFSKPSAYELNMYNGVLQVSNVRGGYPSNTGVIIADGQWHHLTLSFDAGVINGTHVYVDGIQVLETTTDITSQNTDFLVGGRSRDAYYGGAAFIGLIDEVAIFDRLLTTDEIPQHAIAAGHVDAKDIGEEVSSLNPVASTEDLKSYNFYDAKGLLTGSLDEKGFLRDFVYDSVGNLVSSTRFAVAITNYNPATDTFATLQAQASSSKDQTTYNSYNALNQVDSQTNASGITTEYSYDTLNDLVNEASGIQGADRIEAREKQIRRDYLGRVIGELNGTGSALYTESMTPVQVDALYAQYGVSHSYDLTGQRVRSIDANGNATYFYYDVNGNLSHTVNAAGEVQQNSFNAFNQVDSTTTYRNRISTLGLQGGFISTDLLSRISVVADSTVDSVSTFSYTTRGQLSQVVDAEGYITQYAYNIYGERVSSTRTIEQANVDNAFTAKTVTDLTRYDQRGLLIETVQDSGDVAATTQLKYDAFGRIIERVDGQGNITRTQYNNGGRDVIISDALNAQQQISYDAVGRVLNHTDSLGAVTSYVYNDTARTITVTSPEGIVTVSSANRHGENVQISDGNGNTTSYQYDKDGRLTRVQQQLVDSTILEDISVYDEVGLITDSINASGQRIHYTYDAVNRALTRTLDADGLALTTVYEYDGSGNRVRITDANTIVTETVYNRRGEGVQVTVDPAGLNLVSKFTLDGDGNTVKTTQGDLANSAQRTVSYQYDGLKRQTGSSVDPTGLNLSSKLVYDDNGRVVARIDANGNTSRFVYDETGLERFTISAEGSVNETRYNSNGQIVETIRYAREIQIDSVDAQVSLTQVQSLITVDSSADQHTWFAYNTDNQRVYQVTGLGETTEYRYDANGSVTETIAYDKTISLATTMDSASINSALSALGYNGTQWFNAQRNFTVYDTVHRARFNIDALGFVTENAYDKLGNVISSVRYAQSIIYSAGSSETIVAGQLNLNDPGNRTTRYILDSANRISYMIDSEGYTTEYRYDALGNQTDTIRYANAISISGNPATTDVALLLPATLGSEDRQITMQYDNNNRVTSRFDAKGAEERYTYDASGNRVAVTDRLGAVTRYVFDTADRIRYIIDAEGGVSENRYDAAGQIIETIRYTNPVDTTTMSLEVNSATLQATLALSVETDQHNWFAYDANGNLVFSVNGEGNVIENRYHGFVDNGGTTIKDVYQAHVFDRIVYDKSIVTTGVMNQSGIQAALETAGYGDANWYAPVWADTQRSRVFLDILNREQFSIDAEGVVTETIYDNNGNVKRTQHYTNTVDINSATSESSLQLLLASNTVTRVTDYQYNVRNQLTTKINDSAGLATTTQYTYNASGEVVSIIDAKTNTTRQVYSTDGDLRFVIDANGGVTENIFNSVGQVVKTIRYSTTIDLTGLSNLVTEAEVTSRLVLDAANDRNNWSVFDRNGRLVYNVNSLGAVNQNIYDAKGNLVESISYDRAISTATPMTQADLAAALTLKGYDGINWANSNRVKNFYDNNSRLRYSVNSTGGVIESIYDTRGNTIKTVNYAQPVNYALATTLSTLESQLNSADINNAENHIVYDRTNRVRYAVDSYGKVTEKSYNASGELIKTETYTQFNVYDANVLESDYTEAGIREAILNYVINDNPIAMWRLDETVGTTLVDSTGNGHNATLSTDVSGSINGVSEFVTGYSVSSLSGNDGNSIDFRQGLSARVSSAGLQPTRLSLETWVQLTSEPVINTWTSLISSNEGGGWSLGINENNDLTFKVFVGGVEQTITGSALTVGERYNIAATYDGQVLRLFVNGTELSSLDLGSIADISYANIDPNQTVDVYIGAEAKANNQATRYQTAIIDDVAIYGYALDELDVQRHYNHATDNQITTYVYDQLGRLVSETSDPSGYAIQTQFAYDLSGNVTSTINANNIQSDRFFDEVNRLAWQRDGEGVITTFGYDANGNKTSETIHAIADLSAVPGDIPTATVNDKVMAFVYDSLNRLQSKVVDPAGLALTTNFTYDALGNMVTETNARNNMLSTDYDSLGNAINITDAEGFSTSFTYDVFNNQSGITTGQYSGADLTKQAVATPATLRFAYNALGNKAYQVDALGVVTKFEYDQQGNLSTKIESYKQLASGVDIAEANMTALTTAARISEFTFDKLNRLVEEKQPSGNIIRYTFDNLGQLSEKIQDYGLSVDNKNATTRYTYDVLGRTRYEIDAENNVTRYDYDSMSNVIQVIKGLALDQLGRPNSAVTSDMRLSSFEYDNVNRLVTDIIDPVGLAITTRFEYDAAGNQIAITDANNIRGENVYDNANRLIWQRDGEGYIVSFVYDGQGNKIQETHYRNADANVAQGGLPLTDAGDYITTYTYDKNNRMTERVDPRGIVNQIVYDAVGNILENHLNATALFNAPARITYYTYDLVNKVTNQIDPQGMQTDYEYDSMYNVSKKTVQNNWIDTLNGGIPAVQVMVTDYEYDLNNRKTLETIDPAGLNIQNGFRYDAFGNTVAEISPNAYVALNDDTPLALQLRLDLGLVDTGGIPLTSAALSTTQQQQIIDSFTNSTYYDDLGRPVLLVDALGNARGIEYDAAGNTKRAIQYGIAIDRSVVSDTQAPLPIVDSSIDRITDFDFDKADRETSVTSDITDYYVNDGLTLLSGQSVASKVYDTAGNVTQEKDANNYVTYSYFNTRGEMIGRIDAESFITLYEYDAFGNMSAQETYLQAQSLTELDKANLDLSIYTAIGASQRIENFYDLGNNQVKTIYPNSEITTGTTTVVEALEVDRLHDAFGNIIEETTMHRASDANPYTAYISYDAMGRVVSEIQLRADELIKSDNQYFVDLRKDMGIVDGSGNGKLAVNLIQTDIDLIQNNFIITNSYDDLGNIRETIEGDHTTTYEFDAANRLLKYICQPLTESMSMPMVTLFKPPVIVQ